MLETDLWELWVQRPTFSSTPAGTTMGRKLSECGQMGVTIIAGTEGWIMDAPAAAAYAVLPVGVDTIRPSPCTDVIYFPSRNRSILLRYGDGPRSMTTSLSTSMLLAAGRASPSRSASRVLASCFLSLLRCITQRKRLRSVRAAWPSRTLVSCSSKLSKRKGVRKPREPKWKAMTGGTDCWKSSEAYSRVPSPPRQTIKSMRSVRSSRPSLRA